jgi:signal peptidase I
MAEAAETVEITGPSAGDGEGSSAPVRREGGPTSHVGAARRGAGKSRKALVEWAVVVVVALVAALVIKTFALQAFWIPSQSMEPTLYPGYRVLVTKVVPSYHDGEIVVFRRPPNDVSTDPVLIKRIIATGGQQLYVSDCRVYVNGKQISQPYLPKGWEGPGSPYCTSWSAPGTANLPDPYTVPRGYYFVMGDNRTDSDDSRYWGPVPASYLIGQALVLIWPPSHMRFF